MFETGRSSKYSNVVKVEIRKLTQLDTVELLSDLGCPPGNHLEALTDDRKGHHSIRINDALRICFKWEADRVSDVEIVDYP